MTSLERALERVGNFLQSPLLLIIRLYWGINFALAGFNKFMALDATTEAFRSMGLPLPFIAVILASAVELVGGVCLALGFFSRLASLFLIIVMVTAYITASHEAVMLLVRNFDPTEFFKASPFLFLFASVLVFCFGPGYYSVDHLRRR